MFLQWKVKNYWEFNGRIATLWAFFKKHFTTERWGHRFSLWACVLLEMYMHASGVSLLLAPLVCGSPWDVPAGVGEVTRGVELVPLNSVPSKLALISIHTRMAAPAVNNQTTAFEISSSWTDTHTCMLAPTHPHMHAHTHTSEYFKNLYQ